MEYADGGRAMSKKKYSLLIPNSLLLGLMEMWTMREMPCDLRIRRAKTKGYFALQVTADSSESDAINFIYDIKRVLDCRMEVTAIENK